MKKDFKNGLDFILRKHIKDFPSDFLNYVWLILFFITLFVAAIDTYVFKIKFFIFLTLGILPVFHFY